MRKKTTDKHRPEHWFDAPSLSPVIYVKAQARTRVSPHVPGTLSLTLSLIYRTYIALSATSHALSPPGSPAAPTRVWRARPTHRGRTATGLPLLPYHSSHVPVPKRQGHSPQCTERRESAGSSGSQCADRSGNATPRAATSPHTQAQRTNVPIRNTCPPPSADASRAHSNAPNVAQAELGGGRYSPLGCSAAHF